MTACSYCNHEMLGRVSCAEVPVKLRNGGELAPVRVDAEREGPFCHDCFAPAGGLHHPGCDAERCPNCGGQIIACDCT